MKPSRVTVKGQVTIPQEARVAMGIKPAETLVEFAGEGGRWYLRKVDQVGRKTSRFRKIRKGANLQMTSDEIMALTRAK